MDENLFFRLARSENFDLTEKIRILDFGCGEGAFVNECAAAGYDAWGCDISIDGHQGRLKAIIRDPYALPFADGSFDFVVSHQVFEHVQQPEAACRELARILRPGGLSIHVFPSRHRLIEPHVYVPLASFYRSPWWLSMWAKLGVRNDYQAGLSSGEVFARNRDFLRDETNYLTRSEILGVFASAFAEVRFIEHRLIETSGRIPRVGKRLFGKVLAGIYAGFYQRIVLAK
jgi:SAM-dependent methyltransferase